MLKAKIPKELDLKLAKAVDESRKLLMNLGYFVRDVLAVDENTVDVFALKESLLESEKIRIRIVNPTGGVLTIQTVKNFFAEQARVFDVKGMLVSLNTIPKQTEKFISERELPVFGPNWLEKWTDLTLG
jgi:hypothetical protein